MRQRAGQLKVTGWVKNRFDGSVEAVVQGEPFAVDAIVEWVRQGSPAARVDSVDVESAEEEGEFTLFDKRPTS